jgi:cbb3-type cytochrome oxidase subunit 3
MIYLLVVVVLLLGLALVWFLWRTGPKTRGRSVATGALFVGLLAALAAVIALAYRKQRKV